MSRVDERVADLLRSPLGCLFLVIADASRLTPQEIARPRNSLYFGAHAASLLEVWSADHQQMLQEALRRGPQHADLARIILAEPAAAWWFGPLERENQVYAPYDGIAPGPEKLITPGQPPNRWERYAQKTTGSFFTSTLMEGAASLLIAEDEGVGDYHRESSPYPCWQLRVEASARIFEVDGAQAWHDLCLRYPAEKPADRGEPDFSGDAGQLVPDWSAVAADWDGVHLTFGGWLTAEQVRVESPAGWTYHWAWDAEQMLWLRWKFAAVARMFYHAKVTHSPVEMPHINIRVTPADSESTAVLRRLEYPQDDRR